ncbi:MAG: gamma-glutamylcyclotransferase [Clostridia bacterium]|nr:gamma-glutamylcyclotransferase [Clostridia bacterium]
MNHLFVYGTLKSKKVQIELFGKELKTKKAELLGYSLYEAEDGFYFIKEQKDKKVKGYVLEINDYDLKICDAFEMCPDMYQRKEVTAVLDGKTINTFVYIRVDDVGNYIPVENFDSYCKFDEDEFIATEIKEFKEKEHPEFYTK